MKKFALMSVSALALSTVAQATSPMGSPILNYSKSNGSVSPPHRKTAICNFESGEFTKYNSGPSIRPRPVTREAKFTGTVRSVADVRNLLRAASRENKTIDQGPVRAGGGAVLISGNVAKGSKKVFLKGSKEGRLAENSSREAQDLIEFVQLNCEAQ